MLLDVSDDVADESTSTGAWNVVAFPPSVRDEFLESLDALPT